MALAISASLAGPTLPQVAQIVVTGLTVGQVYVVTGQASGITWVVRGGQAVPAATQVVLTDVATPVNAPIVYTVASGAEYAATSVPLTVPYPGEYVLTSLDGRLAVGFDWHGNDNPRDVRLRTATFEVPGRTTPVVRWDVASGETGELMLRATPAQTQALRLHLRERGPLMVLRTDGAQLDLAPVEYVAITRVTHVSFGFDGTRLWSLAFEVIDDPEPATVLAVSTWDDFDVAYSTPSYTRTNLNTNPSAETATTGYTASAATLTRLNTPAGYAAAGSYFLNAAYSASALPSLTRSVLTLPDGAVGQWVGIGVSMRGASGATHARVRIQVGTTDSYSAYLPVSQSAIARFTHAVQVPAGATTVTTSVAFYGSGAGAVVTAGATRVDAWQIETAPTQAQALARVADYFDGAVGGGTWTGTAHASTATRLDAPTWDDFDAEWASLTWDQFDQVDWSTR